MRKLILAATAAATLVGPAVATAGATALPAKGFTVHACVKHTKHGLKTRLAQKCQKGEKGAWLRLPASHDTNSKTGPQGPQGIPGKDGTNGKDGAIGPMGPMGPMGPIGATGLAGSFFSVEKYPNDVNGVVGNSIATVACDPNDADHSQQFVAIAGGVQTANDGTDMYGTTNQLPISASFPGRMDWNTNTPKPNRLDGWVVQFAGQGSQHADGVSVWALCVPKANVGHTVVNYAN
jgi:hypothetical protein